MKQLHSLIWKEGKFFIAKALEVEVTSQGKNEQEALSNLTEALELYFEGKNLKDILTLDQPKLQNISLPIHA